MGNIFGILNEILGMGKVLLKAIDTTMIAILSVLPVIIFFGFFIILALWVACLVAIFIHEATSRALFYWRRFRNIIKDIIMDICTRKENLVFQEIYENSIFGIIEFALRKEMIRENLEDKSVLYKQIGNNEDLALFALKCVSDKYGLSDYKPILESEFKKETSTILDSIFYALSPITKNCSGKEVDDSAIATRIISKAIPILPAVSSFFLGSPRHWLLCKCVRMPKLSELVEYAPDKKKFVEMVILEHPKDKRYIALKTLDFSHFWPECFLSEPDVQNVAAVYKIDLFKNMIRSEIGVEEEAIELAVRADFRIFQEILDAGYRNFTEETLKHAISKNPHLVLKCIELEIQVKRNFLDSAIKNDFTIFTELLNKGYRDFSHEMLDYALDKNIAFLFNFPDLAPHIAHKTFASCLNKAADNKRLMGKIFRHIPKSAFTSSSFIDEVKVTENNWFLFKDLMDGSLDHQLGFIASWNDSFLFDEIQNKIKSRYDGKVSLFFNTLEFNRRRYVLYSCLRNSNMPLDLFVDYVLENGEDLEPWIINKFISRKDLLPFLSDEKKSKKAMDFFHILVLRNIQKKEIGFESIKKARKFIRFFEDDPSFLTLVLFNSDDVEVTFKEALKEYKQEFPKITGREFGLKSATDYEFSMFLKHFEDFSFKKFESSLDSWRGMPRDKPTGMYYKDPYGNQTTFPAKSNYGNLLSD